MSRTEKYIEKAKKRYVDKLAENGDFEAAAKKSKLGLYEPLLEKRFMHPEGEPCLKDYNENLVETLNDIAILNMELQSSSLEYEKLAEDTFLRLNNLRDTLNQQKELQQDISMLCNAYSCFSNVVLLTDHVQAGNASYINGIFCAKIKSTNPIAANVISVEGNGYEGNRYVLNQENEFVSQSSDTSKRVYLTDNSLLTHYEYSRLLTSISTEKINPSDYLSNNTLKDSLPAVNYDAIPAQCMITLKTNVNCNKITISSTQPKGIQINGIYISDDNTSYKNVLNKPVLLSKIQNDYINNNYIDKSGLFCFSNTKYIRISLEATTVNSEESIGYYKTVITYKDNNSGVITDNSNSSSDTEDWYVKYEDGDIESSLSKNIQYATTISQYTENNQNDQWQSLINKNN